MTCLQDIFDLDTNAEENPVFSTYRVPLSLYAAASIISVISNLTCRSLISELFIPLDPQLCTWCHRVQLVSDKRSLLLCFECVWSNNICV